MLEELATSTPPSLVNSPILTASPPWEPGSALSQSSSLCRESQHCPPESTKEWNNRANTSVASAVVNGRKRKSAQKEGETPADTQRPSKRGRNASPHRIGVALEIGFAGNTIKLRRPALAPCTKMRLGQHGGIDKDQTWYRGRVSGRLRGTRL